MRRNKDIYYILRLQWKQSEAYRHSFLALRVELRSEKHEGQYPGRSDIGDGHARLRQRRPVVAVPYADRGRRRRHDRLLLRHRTAGTQ